MQLDIRSDDLKYLTTVEMREGFSLTSNKRFIANPKWIPYDYGA